MEYFFLIVGCSIQAHNHYLSAVNLVLPSPLIKTHVVVVVEVCEKIMSDSRDSAVIERIDRNIGAFDLLVKRTLPHVIACNNIVTKKYRMHATQTLIFR